MSSAYGASPSESTEIPRWLWRAVVGVFWLIAIGGIAMIAVVALGLFDPPHAPDLLLERTDADGLAQVGDLDGARLYALPLPDQPPLTLELRARNDGEDGSGWGLWLTLALADGTAQDVLLIINREGEVSTPIRAPEQDGLGLHSFLHAEAGDNTVYAHLGETGDLTLRLNDEIVEAGRFPGATIAGGGPVLYRAANVEWTYLRVYGRAVDT